MSTSSKKSTEHLDELDVLDAERILAVARLRIRLLHAVAALLPAALKQARGGSPALLRLIARLSTQRTLRDRTPKK